MAALNQCNFIGNIGRDPDLRYTASGKAVANFSIAVTEKYNGEDQTEWVNVVAWNKLAEVCGKYLHKGSPVYISGKMQTRKWEDKDGNTKYTTEIIAFQMQMLGSKGGGQPQQQPRYQAPPAQPSRQQAEIPHQPVGRGLDHPEDDDGIPF